MLKDSRLRPQNSQSPQYPTNPKILNAKSSRMEPATSSSLDFSAALLHFSCLQSANYAAAQVESPESQSPSVPRLNLASSGFCNVLSNTLVRKQPLSQRVFFDAFPKIVTVYEVCKSPPKIRKHIDSQTILTVKEASSRMLQQLVVVELYQKYPRIAMERHHGLIHSSPSPVKLVRNNGLRLPQLATFSPRSDSSQKLKTG